MKRPMQYAAMLAAGLVTGQLSTAALAADLIVTNAKVATMVKEGDFAQAVAIDGGKITAVGSTAQIAGMSPDQLNALTSTLAVLRDQQAKMRAACVRDAARQQTAKGGIWDQVVLVVEEGRTVIFGIGAPKPVFVAVDIHGHQVRLRRHAALRPPFGRHDERLLGHLFGVDKANQLQLPADLLF